MTKVLLWIVLVFVALFALRLLNVAKARRRNGEGSDASSRTPPAEIMVKCARCGVYLPRADAVPGLSGLVCGDTDCAKRR